MSNRAAALATGFALFSALTLWYSLAIVGPSFALKTGGLRDFSLGGTSAVVHPGNASSTAAELTSTTAGAEGHVNIAVAPGLKLRQLDSLSTDYRFVSGTCSGGSPRFTANVTNGSVNTSVFFYFAPPPSFTGCESSAYVNTGNLASPSSPADASHLPGGSLNDRVLKPADAVSSWRSRRLGEFLVFVLQTSDCYGQIPMRWRLESGGREQGSVFKLSCHLSEAKNPAGDTKHSG